MSELTTTSNKPIVEQNSVITPVTLLQMAVQQNADLDKLEKFMELAQRWEEGEAKKAYHQAVANFKSETILIMKNKNITYENSDKTKTSYNHATLDHILEVTLPFLSKYGLSHRWDTEQGEGGRITVTCILTHSSGHSESIALSGSPDDSGKKNNIQRVGSTITYLERYTFLAITGLAAKDQDDDGQSSGDRFDKQAYEEGLKKGCEHGLFWFKHFITITDIKDQLRDGNLLAAAELLFSFPNKELHHLSIAPTKNGIFTIEEKKLMSGPEWEEAKKQGIALNPKVDRSM